MRVECGLELAEETAHVASVVVLNPVREHHAKNEEPAFPDGEEKKHDVAAFAIEFDAAEPVEWICSGKFKILTWKGD